MKTNLFYTLLLFSFITNAQNWEIVGSAQFSNAAKSARLAFSPTGEPYVVYQDEVGTDQTRVNYFDGTTWQDLGIVGNGSADSESISFDTVDNSVWVAHTSKSNRATSLYRYNGTSWQNRYTSASSQNVYSKHLGLHYLNNNNGKAMYFFIYPDINFITSTPRSINISGFDINNNRGIQSQSASVAVGGNNTIAVDKYGNLLSNRNTFNAFTADFNLTTTTGNSNTTGFNSKSFSQQAKHYDVVKNRWIAHTREWQATEDVLQFYVGSNKTSSQPNGSPNAQGNLVSIDMDSENTVYITYADTNSEVKVERYKGGAWSYMNTLPTISTTSTGFFSQIAVNTVNTVNDDVYFLYRDNEKLTLLKYNKPPSLTKYYVDKDATGDGSGDSWANAMTSLDLALNDADETTSEIWIADGKYTASSGTNAYAINIDNLKIYGGFNGTETNLSERDFLDNETILSGDVNNDDSGAALFNEASRTENNQHVVFITGNNIVLDGVTITGGFADATSGDNFIGAGIFIEETVVDFTLKNSNVKDNVCFGGGNFHYWPVNNTTITIENSKFSNNVARWAASVYLITADNVNLTVNLHNNLFHRNKIRNRNSTSTGSTGDVWIRAFGNNSIVTSATVNSTFSNFSSEGTTANRIQAPLVLSENNGSHTAKVANCIVFNNTALSQVYDISPAISGNLASSLTVSNSIGQENFSLVTSKTNISNSDPLFTDIGNNNFQLSAGSPAIDAGDNAQLPASLITDLLGNQRIFNTTVDIGAYEFGSIPLSVAEVFVENEIRLFPNPFHQKLQIQSDLTIKSILLSNSLGQVVLKTKSKEIDTSDLKNGIYFIQILLDNGDYMQRKILKN